MKNQFNKRKMKEIQERRNHLEKTCKNLKVTHTEPFDDRIFFYKPIRLLYCKVPKCGSSYWMRLFKALQFKQQIKDPFSIPRFEIHQQYFQKIKLKESIKFNDTTKVIVTRNPYTRLYSAYIDKIYLPEKWISVGRAIVYFYRSNASLSSRSCGNDVTFVEFLKMIAYRHHMPLRWQDPHWLPIEQLCSPCTYKYNFIIRQETFSRDRDYLVSKVGIKEQSILKYNNISHSEYTLKSIKDLCYSVSKHFIYLLKSKCYRIEVILQRLFVSFQIQGYIREDARFDLSRFGDLKRPDIKTITEVFQNIYKEYPVRTRNDWKEQRRRFVKNAYKLVDTEILEEIKKFYHLDFQIFNYDTNPEEIFGN